MQLILHFLKGFCIGTAETLPGISGSTIALILSIYDDLITFFSNILECAKAFLLYLAGKGTKSNIYHSFKRLDLRFGLTVGIGVLVAIMSLASLVSYLLEVYPRMVYAFFFGLVLASISIPYSKITSASAKTFFTIVLSTVITFLILGLQPIETQQRPEMIYVFFGGFVGIIGLLLPGVSGAFILLLLGLYEYVIGLVKSGIRFELEGADILRLVSFGAGLGIGFVIFVKLIKLLLEKYNNVTYAVLTGVMIGSLRVLWPFYIELCVVPEECSKTLSFPSYLDETSIALIALILLGFLIVPVVQRLTNPQADSKR